MSGDATGVEDAAGALPQHDRRDEVHGQHYGAHDHRHLCVELGDIEVGDAPLGNSVTRVVEQAIDPAESCGRPFYQFPQLLISGNIGLHEARCGPKLARQRFTCVAPAARDDHGGAFLYEEFSRARADAARAANDDCDLAIEDFHLCLLL